MLSRFIGSASTGALSTGNRTAHLLWDEAKNGITHSHTDTEVIINLNLSFLPPKNLKIRLLAVKF